MRTDQLKNMMNGTIVAMNTGSLNKLLSAVNNGLLRSNQTVDNNVYGTHGLAYDGEIAIITVDGTMIKRNTDFNAECGNFIPYTSLETYISEAENNEAINTIVFKVDTNGGDTQGLDQIGEMIYNSSKQTVTYYDNNAYSAGIWAFTASDIIIASEMTSLGSIGVMAILNSLPDEEEKSTQLVLVSENAANKNCSLNGDCVSKVQTQINHYEEVFLSRVSRNTNLSKEFIISEFNKGDAITSTKALEIGFINGIMSFGKLISSIKSGELVDKYLKQKENIMTDEQFNEIKAIATQDNSRIKQLVSENEELRATVTALTSEKETLTASITENEVSLTSKYNNIVALGMKHNIDQDGIKAMIETGDETKAAAMVLDLKSGTGSQTTGDFQNEDKSSDEDPYTAYAKTNSGRIR